MPAESCKVVTTVMFPATVPIMTGALVNGVVLNDPWLAPAGIVNVAVVGGPLANFASYSWEPPDAGAKVRVIVPVIFNGYVPPSDTDAEGWVPATPVAGSPLIVADGGALMTSVNACTTDGPMEVRSPRVAVIVNGELPAAVGLPSMTPVEESRAKPAGSVPVVTAQLRTGAPATVSDVAGYGIPTTPLGRVDGLIVNVPTVNERLAVAVIFAASVTVTEIVDVPPAVGAPLIMPVLESSARLAGRPVALQL